MDKSVIIEIAQQASDYLSPTRLAESLSPHRQDEIVGIGAARLVLNGSDNTVYKIGVNNGGLDQNRIEANIWMDARKTPAKSYLAEIYTYDEDKYQWLQMEELMRTDETIECFETEKEKIIAKLLESYGVTLNEVEVGYDSQGNLVAYDYGSA